MLALTRRLIADVGFEPLARGWVRHAGRLKAVVAVVIAQRFGGADPLTVFTLVDRAG